MSPASSPPGSTSFPRHHCSFLRWQHGQAFDGSRRPSDLLFSGKLGPNRALAPRKSPMSVDYRRHGCFRCSNRCLRPVISSSARQGHSDVNASLFAEDITIARVLNKAWAYHAGEPHASARPLTSKHVQAIFRSYQTWDHGISTTPKLKRPKLFQERT